MEILKHELIVGITVCGGTAKDRAKAWLRDAGEFLGVSMLFFVLLLSLKVFFQT